MNVNKNGFLWVKIIILIIIVGIIVTCLINLNKPVPQKSTSSPKIYDHNNLPSPELMEKVRKEIIVQAITESIDNKNELPQIHAMIMQTQYKLRDKKLFFEMIAAIGKVTKDKGVFAMTKLSPKGYYVISWSAAFTLNLLNRKNFSKKIVKRLIIVCLYHEMLHIKLDHPYIASEDHVKSEEKHIKEECLVHYMVIRDVLRPLKEQGEDLFPYLKSEEKLNKILLECGDNSYDKKVIEFYKKHSNSNKNY